LTSIEDKEAVVSVVSALLPKGMPTEVEVDVGADEVISDQVLLAVSNPLTIGAVDEVGPVES
jgi:hypothetical protein